MTVESAAARRARIEATEFTDMARNGSSGTGAVAAVRDVWRYRELLGNLVRRELKARYKNSTLGVAWSLFRPLVQLAIYYVAIGNILGAARSVPDFAVFVFIGLTMWALFADVVQSGTTSIVSNSGLIKKVYLPREIFPLSAVGSALFNFAVQLMVLLVGIAVLSHFRISWDLVLAPAAVLVLLTFSAGVALFLSAVNVYLRDTQHLVEIAITVLFWLSPIVYSYTFVHNAVAPEWLRELYLANPVTLCIIAMQRALWASGVDSTGPLAQTWPDALEVRLLVAFAISLIVAYLAHRVFARLQGNFAQEI